MQLHELRRVTPQKTKKRVGRGGKRGKTSGKGHKGQKARAGSGPRPEIRDLIKKLPKRRGYGKNRAQVVNATRVKPETVNLSTLQGMFDADTTITPAVLVEKKIVRTRRGRVPQVKLLGTGEIEKKFTVTGCLYSESAKQKIEKAGGSISA